MSKKNILVLGAGALQVPLINRVKEKGYNPVVVSLHSDEPGMQIVKDTIVADFVDKELMLQYARQYDIAGIVTDQTDLPVRAIAYVAERMGLPGIGYDTACLFTDKFLMREKCRELGIATLEYKLVDSYNDAREFFVNLAKPIIIKPLHNQGSKGVCKVSTLAELEDKYEEAERYSQGDCILLEEFVKGEEELVIESVALDGWCENLVCGDTYYFNIPDVFSARQRIFPSTKNPAIVEKALTLNKRIIEGFGLNRGLTHGEYIVFDGKVYLIEIAARGGGVYISSDIVPLMTGFDTTSFIIDIATKHEIARPSLSDKGKVVCYTAFFLPEGIIESVKGIEEVIKQPFIHHNNLSALTVGKIMKKNTDKTSRFFMVLDAGSLQEMNDRIKWIQQTLKVEVNSYEQKNRRHIMGVVKLIINGTTQFSTMIAKLVEMEGGAEIVAFTTARRFINEAHLDGKPVVPFEDLANQYDSKKTCILNTIGYSKMNTIRERVNAEIEESGFTQFSYISSKAFIAVNKEDLENKGVIIMPNAFIGTDVQIGKSVVVYSNCSLTHDIHIEDNVFLGSGCVIGGRVRIGRNSFIGMNSTIKNRISLAPFTLVGCGSNVLKTVDEERCVIVGNPASVLRNKDSIGTI